MEKKALQRIVKCHEPDKKKRGTKKEMIAIKERALDFFEKGNKVICYNPRLFLIRRPKI